ncbi:Retron-type reverse transcriptase [Thiorhodovibrio winogradskyi]|uniref:Retron-type reverse transcriptase n=1 Tax=Thiorhodovibrio winogradskyi TaxID=77007 RepID=A0ABZ0SCH0_9GAMM|nr:hypothetical protein [Thiorhodovibrio winogradskyi]
MSRLHIDDILADPHAYAAAIRKVFGKRNRLNKGFMQAYGGVSYYAAYLRNRSLGKVLAKTVASGDYVFAPVDLWFLKLRSKTRAVHRATFIDQIIGAVVYQVVSENARVLGLPGLYSYLPGKSNYQAMQDFAAYVRDYRRRVPDPRKRGLFVLQSDFEKYGDNLPVHQDAFIWTKLREVIEVGTDRAISDNAWQLIQSLVRPVVRDPGGLEFSRLRGIPMGTPIVPMVNVLAAAPLDEMLADTEGAFYARFNDDFLIAHPDRDVVINADAKINELLKPLGVQRNKKKDILTYFNGAGRRCEMDSRFQGSSHIDFLGLSVTFAGTVAAGPKRIARVMTEVCRRLDRTAHAIRDYHIDARAACLSRVTNRMLTPGHAFTVPGMASMLRDTNDRSLLRDIDYRIARKIVQCATEQPGVRGFRRLSMRELRERHGLMSLVQIRNAAIPRSG